MLVVTIGVAICASAANAASKSDKLPEDIAASLLPESTTEVIQTVSGKSAVTGHVAQDATDTEDPPDLLSTPIDAIQPSFDYAWGDVDMATLPKNFSVNTDDVPISRTIHTPLLLQWQPSNLWYHPLYFEDPALERYGHTYESLVLQQVVSTGRFVGQAVTLPYHATLQPPHSREYPLGYYRPGDCAPYLKYRPAWNNEAAVHQALAVVGLVFLIP